ncbi:MAG: DUF4198 domain-containing protein [Blastocatellia bacterium]|nr:DUF4198 domain-containing protein [Blastocatellia bacterium]
MKRLLLTITLFALFAIAASAHDMFLKFDSFFLAPNSSVVVQLLNGEFDKSENTITRDRMRDVSLVSPAGLAHPAESDWSDEGKTSSLRLQTGAAGTYVVGTSTKPKELSMKAANFNRYLQLEGVIDTFIERRKNKQLTLAATERYSKHVKAIFQVGDTRTDTYKTPLNYPVEIIPQQNPYELKAGSTLSVLCVRDGQPLVNQYVLYGVQSRGQRHFTTLKTRTDNEGVARIPLTAAGRWYVKFIHMTQVNEPPVNYESRWATLTFELK